MDNLVNTFELTQERQQELRGIPYGDRIYKDLFGDNISIKRYASLDNLADQMIYDKSLHIDVVITLPNGMRLTAQDKFLSPSELYHNVTIEYETDTRTHIVGDWGNLQHCQLYTVAYFADDYKSFDRWITLDLPRLIIATHQKQVSWMTNYPTTNNYACSNFKYTPHDEIPVECIIAKGGNWR